MGYDKCLLGGRFWHGDRRQQGEGLDRSIQDSAMFEFLVSEVDDGCDLTPASVGVPRRSALSGSDAAWPCLILCRVWFRTRSFWNQRNLQ